MWTRYAWMCLAALAGCHPPPVESGGLLVHQKFWRPVVAELTTRAEIDMRCVGAALTLVRLQGKLPVAVRADGCGRTALYSRALRRHYGRFTAVNSTWVLEATSGRPYYEASSAPAARDQDDAGTYEKP